jgi:hypothetical protein
MGIFTKEKPKTYVDSDGKPVSAERMAEIKKESDLSARRRVNGALGKSGGKSFMEGMFDTAGMAGQGFIAVMLAMLAKKLWDGSEKFTGGLMDVFKGEAIHAGNVVPDKVPGVKTGTALVKGAGRGINTVMHSNTVQTGVHAVGNVADKAGDIVHSGVNYGRDLDTRAAHTVDGIGKGGKPAALSTLRQQSGPPATLQAPITSPAAGGGTKTTVPHQATGAPALLDGGP